MSAKIMTPILFDVKGRIGHITLNRPQALNALNKTIVVALTKKLKKWQDNPDIDSVVIKGTGKRAFCVGGDLRAFYEAKQDAHEENLLAFFKDEYQLNYAIRSYPKPYIALMHGYSMGGGLGLSVHGTHRIICEGSQLAMPEVAIGFFPDVGGSYFLNQCPGYLGMYLALSGVHITAEDGLYAGLANHSLKQEDYEDFMETLSKNPAKTKTDVDVILQKFQQKPKLSGFLGIQDQIDRIFSQERFDDVMRALAQEKSDFAKNCLEMMAEKSPTSLKVTFELMKRSRGKSLRETLEYDYLLVKKFVRGHDLFEGIRSLIIDKERNPQWRPKALSDVPASLVEDYFDTVSLPKLFG